MKASIIITGSGINSKSTLKANIWSFDCEVLSMNFGNTEIRFSTKKEAVKVLSNAFQNLRSDKEDWAASMGSYVRGKCLSYDAGVARIV